MLDICSDGTPEATTATAPSGPARRWRLLLVLAATPVLRLLVAYLAVQPGARWRTGCQGCGSSLAMTGQGWAALLPPGRCGQCGRQVGAAPYAVEVIMVVGAGVMVLAAPSALVLLAGMFWLACAVPLVFIDLRVRRLPDLLTYSAAVGTLSLLTVEAVLHGHGERLTRSLAAAAVYGGAALLVAVLLGRRGLGVGDAKLLVSIAALLGWWSWAAVLVAVFVGFLSASLVGVVWMFAGRASRTSQIPLGPHLVAGTMALLAVIACR